MEEFKIGDEVTVKGLAYIYGKGTIINFVQSKAVIKFGNSISYIPLEHIRHFSQ